MSLDLTNLDRRVLGRSPLSSVIFQVRYDVTAAASDAHIARTFFERLSADGSFEKLDQVMESALNIALGPGSAPAVAQQPATSGWRVSTADGARVVMLMPTHVAVEATSYEGWEADFAPLLADVLDAVAELVSPVFEQRLGLRYVNQITEPETADAQGWRGWIDDSLLAVATHEEIGPMVAFLRQQTILQLDEEARCTINSGFSPDPSRDELLTFLLDCDIAREGTRPFDVTGVREAADQFNSYALRLFQLATTPQLREVLARGN